MSNPRSEELTIPIDVEVSIEAVEHPKDWMTDTTKAALASLIYSSTLALSAGFESGICSPSSRLAYLQASFSAARLGGDLARITKGKQPSPYYFMVSETTVALGLLALTNLLEGNTVSFILAAQGAILGGMVARNQYGDEKLVSMVKSAGHYISDTPRRLFNGVLGLFASKPVANNNEAESPALTTKKNQ